MPEDARFSSEPTRSSRDGVQLRARLTEWLQAVTGDATASVGPLGVPQGSGMSSETLLFDATWGSAAEPRPLVARLAPDPADVPVFESYDLGLQFDVMGLVATHTEVPVPAPRWLELDPAPIGTPFFVMDRVAGRVPADIPPYVFEGWLLDASDDDRRRLQDASVGLLASLSTIDIATVDVDFLVPAGAGPAPSGPPAKRARAGENALSAPHDAGDTPLRRHVEAQRRYYDWVSGGARRHPIVDEGFAWLEANWPRENAAVVSWGDARIGNIMYELDGFVPVAVLDWEMASIAPPEVDLGWMVFLHRFFQNIAEVMGLPGLPDFLTPDAACDAYVAHGGPPPDDLHWYEVYAGVRHAIIMSRIKDRSVHFGESEWTDDVDAVIPHRDLLRSMLR